MRLRHLLAAFFVILSISVLSSCNLPQRQSIQTPIQPYPSTVQSTPAHLSPCTNQYFPNAIGDRWEYSGTNSLTGAYARSDSINNSNTNSFTQGTTLANSTYSVQYDCSFAGLVATNPIEQYAGILLSSPDFPVNVRVTSNTGTSLPSQITPGNTWGQTADWEASSQQVNVNGRIVIDYAAVGFETVTVQAGTYNALRVVATIRIELTSLHVLAGTYTTTLWLVPQVGLVKSEGSSSVPGVDFTDSMELTSYTPAP